MCVVLSNLHTCGLDIHSPRFESHITQQYVIWMATGDFWMARLPSNLQTSSFGHELNLTSFCGEGLSDLELSL